MKDAQFMSAQEKQKVLRQWELFLKNGLKQEKFTKALYKHLTLHCSFIAHYDINGFYGTYFTTGDGILRFISQFDARKADSTGFPKSIEYGMTYWATDPEYADINQAMISAAGRWIPGIEKSAQACQRNSDIMQAKTLLGKHGITVDVR